MSANKTQFVIELVPPNNRDNIPKYFRTIEKFLDFTKTFGITSKPSDTVSGFDLGLSLASYLLEQDRQLDILFHITCKDVNKFNIHSRLNQLRLMNIKKVLLVTGDHYVPHDLQIHYADSNELVEDVMAKYRSWFESVAVAGYPGGNGHVSNNDLQECDRLRAKLIAGVDCIYTQCIFDSASYKRFRSTLLQSQAGHTAVHVIPSVAIFRQPSSLDIITKYARVKPNDTLIDQLNRLEPNAHGAFCKRYLMALLSELQQCCTNVNVCMFGSYELALDILQELK